MLFLKTFELVYHLDRKRSPYSDPHTPHSVTHSIAYFYIYYWIDKIKLRPMGWEGKRPLGLPLKSTTGAHGVHNIILLYETVRRNVYYSSARARAPNACAERDLLACSRPAPPVQCPNDHVLLRSCRDKRIENFAIITIIVVITGSVQIRSPIASRAYTVRLNVHVSRPLRYVTMVITNHTNTLQCIA